MPTATLEHEQEDVNPDDYLEKQRDHYTVHQQQLLWPVVSLSSSTLSVKSAGNSSTTESITSTSDRKIPLSAANTGGNSSSSSSAGESPQLLPLFKLKKRHRNKENEATKEGQRVSNQNQNTNPVIRKRSLLEVFEADLKRREKESTENQQKQNKFLNKLNIRKKLSLSLGSTNFTKNRTAKVKEVEKQLHSIIEDKPIECSPPVFEEEEEEEEEEEIIVELPTPDKQQSIVHREKKEDHKSCENLSGKSKRSSQPIDWDQVEPYVEEERSSSPFDFDLLFKDRKERRDKGPPRTYPGCSSSRLCLSKNFQNQQQQQPNGQPSSSTKVVYDVEVTNQNKRKLLDQLPGTATEAKCAKLTAATGEDDMSIHHQQQFYHPPLSSVSSSTSVNKYQSDVFFFTAPSTSSEETIGKMSGHSHYTRSKVWMKEVAATELAIAQSLSEDQQNLINAGASAVVVNMCPNTSPSTPASIAAAANMNNTLATLCNIGNSCYLNSVLYTLRFSPNFIHNLHHLIEDTDSVYQRLAQNKLKSSSLGRNIPGLHGQSGRSWSSKDLASLGSSTGSNSSSATVMSSGGGSAGANSTINGSVTGAGGGSIRDLSNRGEENLPPKTNRQVVTEQLHELFQNLHRNEAIEAAEPFHAGNILRAVQDVSSTFEGNQQQDAHEFLMCVLDSIRESCQALIKTITDHPDVLINTCPPVPESIEPLVPESKSSGARRLFRRKKESMKSQKIISIANGSSGATTLPKTGSSIGSIAGGGDGVTTTMSDQLSNLKNSLFTKPSSVLSEQAVRERLQALGLDFFRDDFEGVTVAKTKCLACETCTEQKETMIDIAIPIAASEVSDAAKNPQHFYQNSCITREYFRGDNKYRCEVCCGYREAIRSISFEILPRQLILQLKRFNGDMEKINSYIPTPFVLRCFCNTCLPKPDCDKPHIYRLYSVITHVGARMSVGHYIAYTSSLDVHGEYMGCGKDHRRQVLLSGGSLDSGFGTLGSGSGINGGGSGSTGSSKSGSEKSTSVHLKKLFCSKKTSSAGDMSKKIKNNVVNKLNLINGMEGLNLINGSSASSGSFGSQSGGNSPNSNGTPTSSGSGSLLASRIPCAGLNCCGIHLKNSHLSLYGHSSNSNSSNSSGSAIHNSNMIGSEPISSNGSTVVDCGDISDNPQSNCSAGMKSTSPVNGSTPSTASSMVTTVAAFEQSLSQQLWHMCDDDKIKVMSQAEFEELLSPNRRHVITPYLLFYVRYDLVQPQQPQQQQKEASTASINAGMRNADHLLIVD
ncbi:uncharacterized protein LOC129753516 [Uranotaenia lowii]|uniref:uncharacterized protein LOC129753516 n=1 Tax=Uranotaenia lowii TaxID=190385 RepID=UPI002479E6F6|nr:uncharacterized protein LOC129753516 [Uranotaenia lowii]XP_055605318.1 uncharacterized protein LOC129753516 [Uranotaenia lowii]